MEYNFIKATAINQDEIWVMLQQGIIRRKNDGSNQWQDGYPNMEIVKIDIEKSVGYVLTLDDKIIGYSAVIINDEPAYEKIEGKWLRNGNFIVFHRLVIAENNVGSGFSKKIIQFIEEIAKKSNIYNIKVDTNYDNLAMLKNLEKMDYLYCGEVYFRGYPRKAFQKLL